MKAAVNRMLRRLGYSIVSAESLERMHAPQPVAQPTAVEPAKPVTPTRNLRLKEAINHPPSFCTPYQAPVSNSAAEWVREAANEFRDKGITVLKVDAAAAERWRESLGPDEEVGGRWPAWDWAGSPINLRSPVRKTSSMPQEVVEELRSIFASDDFEHLFRAVLGCPMTVANCRPVKSYPHSDDGSGPQSWHGDGCPPGVVRGVLYLTDVDDGTGPFQYRTAEREVVTMLGKVGDLMLFDASRLVHRAMPPIRKTRQALDFIFMPRLPGTELQVNAAGSNSWPLDPFFYSVPEDNSGSLR